MAKHFFVYILSSKSRTLYIGMTSDIERRIHQHKTKALGGFTARYNINRLVHYEELGTATEAIEREKMLKDWRRELKVELIESTNPAWDDLSADWYNTSMLSETERQEQIPTG
jgi:putative endonuclease